MDWGKFEYNDQRFIILRKSQTFSRTASGKNWRSKPDEVKYEVIPPKYYENYVTAVPFFNHFLGCPKATCRVAEGYTIAGYLPVSITTVDPSAETKVIAQFDFIDKKELEDKAGWREKEVLAKAKEYKSEWYSGKYGVHQRIEFINPEENGVTHSAMWDSGRKEWVA